MIPEYSPQHLDSEAWEVCIGICFHMRDLDIREAPETVSFLELSSAPRTYCRTDLAVLN